MTDQTIATRLRADLTDAMRAKDELRRTTIRAMMTAIKNAEVSGTQAHELTEDQVQALVRTEVKKRRDTAGIYADAGRPEQARREREEADVLAAYLPAQLDAAALREIVAEEIATAGDAPHMGQVIKTVRERVGQQASGGDIAAAVRAALT